MPGTVELELRPGRSGHPVAVVSIVRPDRRNALDLETCEALSRSFGAAMDGGARALVLTGSGGSFCAGADLGTVQDEGFGPALRRVLEGLCQLPLVCLAAVDGHALGAGVQLAVACDLRVAAPGAVFGVPAGRLGLMVDHWTVRRLAQMAGQGVARSLLLGGAQLGGEEAVRVGFAQRLGSLEDALAWAGDISALAPLTLAGHKLALNRVEEAADDPAVEEARRRAWASSDLAEGMAAFRERRAPRFQGR